MKQEFPKLSLVLGGANSGKSAFAERLTRAAGLPKTYVATAQAFDDEMRAKIAKHRVDRGDDWDTVEAPMDIASALGNGVTLVDCLTLWLSNHILADADPIRLRSWPPVFPPWYVFRTRLVWAWCLIMRWHANSDLCRGS